MQKFLLCFIALFYNITTCYAHALTNAQTALAESKQLLLLISPTDNSYQATIQRYVRDKNNHWLKVGAALPAEIGKKGMAWGADFKDHDSLLIKHEGDQRTPIGLFKIGSMFGFAPISINHHHYPYFPVDDTLCIDDQSSQYYNQLISKKSIANPDWHSSETLNDYQEYQLGAVIEYNMHYPPIKGAGSCIFMHSIVTPNEGTLGCVALTMPHLREILTWLEPNDNPVIALLSQSAYQQLKIELSLP